MTWFPIESLDFYTFFSLLPIPLCSNLVGFYIHLDTQQLALEVAFASCFEIVLVQKLSESIGTSQKISMDYPSSDSENEEEHVAPAKPSTKTSQVVQEGQPVGKLLKDLSPAEYAL